MKNVYILTILALSSSSCSTLNESLQLGASMGTLVGAGATYAGYAGSGNSPSFERVALGAGVGLGLGLITSYLIHKDVEDKRQSSDLFQTELHFGDLPPSPFIMPTKTLPKKGGR